MHAVGKVTTRALPFSLPLAHVLQGVDPAMVGKKVYLTDTISGAYAPFSLCSAKDVRVVPEGVSLADAAAVPIAYRTAYRALFQVHVHTGAPRGPDSTCRRPARGRVTSSSCMGRAERLAWLLSSSRPHVALRWLLAVGSQAAHDVITGYWHGQQR